MTARLLCQVVVAACLGLSYFLPQEPVYARMSDFVEIPLETLHDAKPIELRGLISSQTLDIPVPESWSTGEENWLEIAFTPSPQLDAARSSVTLALNGLQIIAYSLEKLPEGQQRILIPANLFVPGENRLTFSGALYLPNDYESNCQNWDDPARWLAIEPGGLIHLSFARHNPQIDLAEVPQVFIEPMEKYLPDPTGRQPLIVLPENSTEDDLTSLSIMSYLMGHNAGPGYEWSPEILNASQWNRGIATNRNVIFIGDAPKELQEEKSDDRDYVGVLSSPWGVGNVILVIYDHDREDGFTPAAVFSDPIRSVLLQGKIAYVEQYSPKAPQPIQKKYSFADLGYLDRTVRGVGRQSLIYRFYVPYDTDPILAKLKLDLFHSPNLDTRFSAFTVYLNGFDIAAIVPGAHGSIGEPITIGLPNKRFRPGLNFIRVNFDLHVSRSSCEHSLESVWGTILSSSTLEVTYRKQMPTPTLAHFPLPFSDPPGSLLVIPDQFQPNDLTNISKLSFLLGASAFQPDRPPEVRTASSFNPKEVEHLNVILVGLPQNNSVTRGINDLLPQPFGEDGRSLQEGYGVQLPTADKEASLGLLQILPSPWLQGGTILVLTGNSSQGLEWTWNAILDPALQNQFSGNVMLVGSDSAHQAIGGASANSAPRTLFQQVADASNIPIVGRFLQKSGQAFLAPALAAVGSALFMVIGIYRVINLWRRRRNLS